jgi:hypothetical protein
LKFCKILSSSNCNCCCMESVFGVFMLTELRGNFSGAGGFLTSEANKIMAGSDRNCEF